LISRIKMRYLFISFCLVLLLPTFSIFAEEEKIAEEEKVPIICHGDKVEFLEHQNKLRAVGHAQIFFEDVKITCDSVDIAMDTKEGVAEGNVVFYQEDTILTGDKVEYNFDTQTGIVYKAGFASEAIYGMGPAAIKEGPKEMAMHKGYMTTCELPKPHYRIHSRTAKIYLDDKVVMRHVIVYLFELPAFYLPYYSYALKPDRPKVTVMPGKDDDWGRYVLTAWRYEYSPQIKGLMHLDYREKRDFASGFDNYYLTRYGTGFVKAYYVNERRLESKKLWKEPRITHERERYMIQHRHDWEIDRDTDLYFEFWGLSDTTLLKDYFYRKEYQKQPVPRSHLSIIKTLPYFTTSLYARRRFNKIFQVTEHQPELRLNVPSIKIGGEDSKLYWRSDNSFVNFSKKYVHPSDVDEDAVRFDSYNQIKHVSKLGFLHVTPYIAGRETYYTKDKYGDHDWWRAVFYTGVALETKFFKIFNFSTDEWDLDINNIRHVITPTVSYNYLRKPTIASEKLFQFDGVDSISRSNQFSFSLENKLQTKRAGQAVDLARLTASTSYRYRFPGGSKFSNVNFDFEFSPYNWLNVEFDTAYDHLQDRFTTFNFDIFANHEDKWKCGFGYRYAHENHSEGTFEVDFKPSPLWKIGIYERFLFKGYPNSVKKIGALQQQEYRVVRDLHCWTSEILYKVSRGEGESIYLVFRLKAFPELPMEFGESFHAPKFGSQYPIR